MLTREDARQAAWVRRIGPGMPDADQPSDSTDPLRPVYILSGIAAAFVVVGSAAGLFVHGLYPDGRWAREALRGGDLVSLVIVAPMMIASIFLAARGSVKALVVLMGTLAYAVYNYAYFAFGAAFNDIFLLHIAVLSLSIFALILAFSRLDREAIRERLRSDRTARWVGAMLVIVGALQGALWVFVVLRFAVTGEVLHDIPVAGQHLVFALDLALLVPSLVLAGVLLFRRTAMGYLLGGVMALMGAAYQLNLMMASAFQARAHVPGVKAFAPESILLASLFVASAVALLRPRSSRASS